MKVRKPLRYVGSSADRPDAPNKVVGKEVYIHDLTRPGMLHGKIKFSEHAHARVVAIDTTRAEKLPGVVAVITGESTPRVSVGFLGDNCALKRGVVRQFRDEIAAVAAIDPDIAQRAVDLIEVEYEPLPAVFDPVLAMAPDAPLVHEVDRRGRPRTNNRLPLDYGHESGDVDTARAASAFVVEDDFSAQLIQQSCMGTAGCIAELDVAGNLTMWAKTQIPFLAQRDYVRALEEIGLAGRNARVIVPALGGGFGTGLDTHCYEFIAILLAHASGRPVKMLYNRAEEFAYLSPRQSARVHVAQGCDENGKLTFRDVHVLQDNGAYGSWGATYPTVMLIPVTSLYDVANVRFSAEVVYTNNTYCQAMRGYGNPEVTWAIEQNLDQLAEKAGVDAAEMRRINCNRANSVTPMGLKLTTCGLDECIEAAARGIQWSERRGADRAATSAEAPRRRRGVGMASLIHVGGSGKIYKSDASGLIMKLDDFGNVNIYYGGVEMGQGLYSAISLTVADALGVSPERVHINETDTGTCPWDVGTHASRGAFMACNAAIMASQNVRARLFDWCARLYPEIVSKQRRRWHADHPEEPVVTVELESVCESGGFDMADGFISLAGAPDVPWARVELGKMLRAVHFREGGDMFTEEVFYNPPNELPNWKTGIGNMSATYTFGTQGVEVEVDEETGDIEIIKMVNAIDVGKVLNMQTLRGQMYGGIAQGVGYALYEEVKTEAGRVLNPGFTDYKIPTASEMAFPIELHFVETNDPEGPFGAKGVGEPGLVPTAPAIANAVYDAIGVRIRDLPMTPEKVLRALKKRRQ